MKPKLSIAFSIMLIAVVVVACNNGAAKEETADTTKEKSSTTTAMFGGYESQVKWGEHIVKIGGCNDCHTPKKMGPNGPEDDMSLMLSGHLI